MHLKALIMKILKNVFIGVVALYNMTVLLQGMIA